MKIIIYRTALLILAVLIISCEEVIEIDLNDAEPVTVIEANISDTTGPYYVHITRTVPFSQNNTPPGVNDAFVTLSSNGLTDTLSLVSDGLYRTNNIIGISGAEYNFAADLVDGIYTSTSFMPIKTNLDSVYTTTNSGGGIGGGSRKVNVVPKYRDPAGVRNFYRFILYVNGQQTEDIFVQSDESRDGQIIRQPLRPRNDIHSGDVLTLEMQCIDENVYRYFYALSLNFTRGLNQTQTPSNPPTNIVGGKLGYFNAHTTQRKSVIAP